ncbi:hypothetical protein EJ04DRAFT_1180 [Polyplosphaeria fusca]|uniref:Uncharacterized protein n=1 Tax=Polyplosphaeria fusca TaxID=682080 RepID=A0A9P4RDA5_9PLEO|nr:hypothetical protein EJ04DRAFT_1180 [Polyplosphaeria fusca]
MTPSLCVAGCPRRATSKKSTLACCVETDRAWNRPERRPFSKVRSTTSHSGVPGPCVGNRIAVRQQPRSINWSKANRVLLDQWLGKPLALEWGRSRGQAILVRLRVSGPHKSDTILVGWETSSLYAINMRQAGLERPHRTAGRDIETPISRLQQEGDSGFGTATDCRRITPRWRPGTCIMCVM